jgi:Ca2+-binding RTX toxin-like protein
MARAFRIDMNAANERPAGSSTSTATGLGVAILTGTGASSRLDYTIVTRGLDWGPFVGQAAQTAAPADNVIGAHFHQAPTTTSGPVRFDLSADDDLAGIGLAAPGGVPVATIRGAWETTDTVPITGFLGSFANPALALGGATDFYLNAHTNAFSGGDIRGQLVLLSTDNGETINGLSGTRDDILPGLGGNDIINGFAGNDTIDGGAGADTKNGGLGNDTYTVENAGDVVNEAAGQGTDTLRSTISKALPNNVEILRLLGTVNLNGFGNGLANTLYGNSGNNMLNGVAGADIMVGLAGNDTFIVDNIGDRTFELVGGGTDIVRASTTYGLTSAAEIEVLQTINNAATTAINLFGNAFNNSVIGNAGNNVLSGGAGADTMSGLAGNDSYFVDNSGDRTVEAIGGGTDLVKSSISYALQAGREIEQLTTTNAAATTAINLIGNEFANVIIGNAGVNTLNGGAGNDTLSAGDGNDFLTGGGGADRFFFVVSAAGTVASGRDDVMDFEDDVDTIYIDKDFGYATVQDVLDDCTSSGGDSAIDLSHNGDDAPRIVLYGLDDSNKLANDIVLI